jgi:transketolase N-terminal domain/subunit
MGKIEEIYSQELICKRCRTMGAQLTKIRGEIEEIKSLMVN